MALFTLYDGSSVQSMSAKDLCSLQIWQGNRILNADHVQRIKQSVGDTIQKLDSTYRIVECPIEDAGGNMTKVKYIIDGQHRAQVLKDYFRTSLCEPDFQVLVIVKQVNSELEIIQTFNTINHVNPITWSDHKLLANLYIAELLKLFNVKKQEFIRNSCTKRPYVYIEKLREVLLEKDNARRLKESREEAVSFAKRVYEWNANQIREAEVNVLQYRKSEGDILLKSAKIGCMLAFDSNLPWVSLLLK